MERVLKREVRERSFTGKFFLVVFFVFNGLMVWWLLDYWGEVAGHLNTGSSAERTGAALGTTFGTGIILVIWTLGAVITGLLAILTRGQRTYVEIPQVDASGKKKCPMCAEMVQRDAKVCRFCNYRFELQARVASLQTPAQAAREQPLGASKPVSSWRNFSLTPALFLLGIIVVVVAVAVMTRPENKKPKPIVVATEAVTETGAIPKKSSQ
jgi:hypothetical protein